MKHVGTQTIQTERLMLRRFTVDDAEPMFRNWASDPEVTRFLTWQVHSDVEAPRGLLEMWVAEYEKPDYYQWAIVYGGEAIGAIAIVSMDDRIEKCEVGYCIGKAFWGRGIMPEALKAVLDYMFDVVGMNRVEARHDANNPNSGTVMKKCGMKYEGTLRQADWNNQGVCDAVHYALLKCERDN